MTQFNFDSYATQPMPNSVKLITLHLVSELVPEVIDDVPTGNMVAIERIEGRAEVADESGEVRWIHFAPDYQTLIQKGVFTQQQLLTVQAWLQNVRNNIEGLVLPPT